MSETILRGAISKKLRETAAIADIVSTRIFAKRGPQNVKVPYVRHWIPYIVPQRTLRGTAGLVTARVQFDIFATDAEEGSKLRELIAATFAPLLDVTLTNFHNESVTINAVAEADGPCDQPTEDDPQSADHIILQMDFAFLKTAVVIA